MNINENAKVLVSYIESLSDFEIIKDIGGNYNHMGATITDSILQAGTKYDTVVKPKVQNLLKQYPEVRTTSGFQKLIDKVGINNLINWKDDEKPSRILGVVNFFTKEKIETEEQLKQWLLQPDNIARLKQLRGIGDKTANYFKIMVGIQENAPDRHLLNFLNKAGIVTNNFNEAQQIINKAADLTGVNREHLDHSIWRYESDKLARSYSNKFENERTKNAETRNCATKEDKQLRYFEELLELCNKKTHLFRNISPKGHPNYQNYIYASADKSGIKWCLEIKKNVGCVGLYLYSNDKELDCSRYEILKSNKSEIEKAFGESLEWDFKPGRIYQVIRSGTEKGGLNNDECWTEIQNDMVDRLIRLEKVLRSYLDKLP